MPDEKLYEWTRFLEDALGWERFNEYERLVRKYDAAAAGSFLSRVD